MEMNTKKRTVNLAIIAIVSVLLLPFMIVSFWSFNYIKNDNIEMFNANLTRFTHNTSMESVNRQIEEIEVIFQILKNQLTREALDEMINPTERKLDPILSTIVNSTFFFNRAIVIDNAKNYAVYPPDKAGEAFALNQVSHPYFAKKNKLVYTYANNDPLDEGEKKTSAAVGINLFDEHAEQYGMLAFELDLDTMSETLREVKAPFNGHFLVASRSGDVIMHPNTWEIFNRTVPLRWFEKAVDLEGHFYDNQTHKHVFYHSFSHPGWVAFTVVDGDEYFNFINRAPQSLFTIFMVCLILYSVILCLCRVYFKQIVTRIYLGVNGVNLGNQPHDLEHIYKQIKTNRQQLEEAQRISCEDTLTGIATRRMFETAVNEMIKQQTPFCIAMIDLDHFKSINDTFGHQVGDEVLKYVSHVGKGVLEPAAHLYRYGGEELIVLFPGMELQDCHDMLDTWRHIIMQRQWREEGLKVTFSGGIVRSQPGLSATQLVERADHYLYQAKHAGRNNIQGEMNNSVDSAAQWIIDKVAQNDMQGCIDIVLQPLVNIQSKTCFGAEVLVRGIYNDKPVYPDSFIPALENNGTILNLDLFVFAQGLTWARERKRFSEGDFSLSFNFSPYEFNDPDFVALICQQVTPDEAPFVILEITETEIMLTATGLDNIRRLQGYGLTVVWDDIHCENLASKNSDLFSTPLVKLDRSVLFEDNLDCAQRLIAFYQQKQSGVIVEGVENEQQLEWLLARNITLAQGYYFSPPVNKHEFEARVLSMSF